MATRGCTQRQFLLRPSAIVNQIVLFCIGVAAKKFGVLLHALCVMSNHYHLALTDPKGRLPEFEAWVNEFVAKALNLTLGRRESLWCQGTYDAGELETEADALAAMTYTITNPVKHCMVTRCDLWPGLVTLPSHIGRKKRIKRPSVYFSKSGNVPAEVEVTFVPPPAYSHLPLCEFVQLLTESVNAKEEQLRAKVRAEGRTFLGRRAVLQQNPFDTPNTPRRSRPRKRPKEQRRRLGAFLDWYREAYAQFKAGFREVLFPPGTYWMQRYAGALCAPG